MKKGQITVGIGVLVTVAMAAIVSGFGYLRSNASETSTRLDKTIEQTYQNKAEISALKEGIATLKNDNSEIKGDIKKILDAVK